MAQQFVTMIDCFDRHWAGALVERCAQAHIYVRLRTHVHEHAHTRESTTNAHTNTYVMLKYTNRQARTHEHT